MSEALTTRADSFYQDIDGSQGEMEKITGIYLQFSGDVVEWYHRAAQEHPEANCRQVVINYKGVETVMTFDEFFSRLGLGESNA